MRLTGRRALVTGAAGGIGRAIVARLRRDGADVIGTDREEAEGLIAGDLTDPDFCDALPSQAAERLGGLDIVVNNAGIITRGPITETTDTDFARTMAINVEAPVRSMPDLDFSIEVTIGYEYEPEDRSVGMNEQVYWSVRGMRLSYPKEKPAAEFDGNSIEYMVACWLEEHEEIDELVWKEVRRKQEEAEAMMAQYDD